MKNYMCDNYFILVLMYVSNVYHFILSIIRSDQGGSRNLFSMKIQIKLDLMLLLSLMIVTSSVHTKVQTTKLTMLNQTFAQIRNLSYQLPDQPRADRAMHQLLCTNIKLTRKVLTVNLIRTILKRNIGTNDVERYVRIVCKQTK